MRYFGALMIFLASSGAGLIFLRAKKKRLAGIKNIYFALELLHAELVTRASPLPELCRLLEARSQGAAADFFGGLSGAMSELGERDFASIWRENARESFACLNSAELDEICRLGDVLGRYELQEQASALELCLTYLRSCQATAESNYPSEKKLGLGLTMAAGLLLIVVLL